MGIGSNFRNRLRWREFPLWFRGSWFEHYEQIAMDGVSLGLFSWETSFLPQIDCQKSLRQPLSLLLNSSTNSQKSRHRSDTRTIFFQTIPSLAVTTSSPTSIHPILNPYTPSTDSTNPLYLPTPPKPHETPANNPEKCHIQQITAR